MLVYVAAVAGQCVGEPWSNTGNLGHSGEIMILGLVIAFIFLTTLVLSTLLNLERRRSRLVVRLHTREVGSQAPTTYTHNSVHPRFKPLPDFAHG